MALSKKLLYNLKTLFNEEKVRQFVESLSQEQLEEFFRYVVFLKETKDKEEKLSLYPQWFREKFESIFGYDPYKRAPLSIINYLHYAIGKFLRNNPGYITKELYDVLKSHNKLYWIVRFYQIDEKGRIVPSDRFVRNLKNLETIEKLDLLRRTEDKLSKMIDLLTPAYLKKLSKSHPGTFFSAIKTIASLYHILSINYKPDEEMIKTIKVAEKEENFEKKKEFLLKYIKRTYAQ